MSPGFHNPAILPPGVGPSSPIATPPARPSGAAQATNGPAFADVLAQRTTDVRFSKHALQRVERRGIELDPSTLARLDAGVTLAAGKGARESLVLVDGTAFVVAVPNRTVVTAVDHEHMREQVFTNIDSAVIA